MNIFCCRQTDSGCHGLFLIGKFLLKETKKKRPEFCTNKAYREKREKK